jgi:hypothetical protein
MADDRGRKPEKSEVRGQRSEVRGQKSEVRSQGSEIRNQKSEISGQRSEVRRRIYQTGFADLRCCPISDRRLTQELPGARECTGRMPICECAKGKLRRLGGRSAILGASDHRVLAVIACSRKNRWEGKTVDRGTVDGREGARGQKSEGG